MFEKEAEEYFKSICGDYNEEYERTGKRHYFVGFDIKNAYLAGAEFGYKEGIKTLDNMTRVFNREHKKYTELRIANEWHYPSKGELPKCDEKTQLMFYVNCYYEIGGETITRKRTVLGYYKNSFLHDDIKLFVEKSKGYEDEHLPKDVIAWKEIVLPKESENGKERT